MILFRLTGGLLLVYALVNVVRMWILNRRMRPYRVRPAQASGFTLPPPLCWQVQYYNRPAYPLIDEAWRLVINTFWSGVAAMILLALGRT